MKKNLIMISAVAASILLFTGCSYKTNIVNKNESGKVYNPTPTVQLEKRTNIIDNIIKQNTNSGDKHTITAVDIVKKGEISENIPAALDKTISFESNNETLLTILTTFLADTKISYNIEPNIDLNRVVTFKVSEKSIYNTLQQVFKNAGYGIEWDDKAESLVISSKVKRTYYLPASLFVKRNLKMSAPGGASNAISPDFDFNNADVATTLLSALNELGTDFKTVSFDKQTGVLVVKDSGFVIDEIDNFITDFVTERTEQFNVQMVVAELSRADIENLGLDITNIQSKGNGIGISSLTGASADPTALASTLSSGGVVISGLKGYSTLGATTLENGANWGFQAIMQLMKSYTTSKVMVKPNVVVQNHSIAYVGNSADVSYVKSLKVTPGQISNGVKVTPDTVEPEISSYRDGVQFGVRVDKYKNKDNISLSLQPILTDTILTPFTVNGNTIQLPTTNIRDGMNVVSVKDGDIIILGGVKSARDSLNKNAPLGAVLPILGEILENDKNSANEKETFFMITVNKLKNTEDTLQTPSKNFKTYIRN